MPTQLLTPDALSTASCTVQVYDATAFLQFHPGGAGMLMKAAGRDCTSLVMKHHPWVNIDGLLQRHCVGTLAAGAQQQPHVAGAPAPPAPHKQPPASLPTPPSLQQLHRPPSEAGGSSGTPSTSSTDDDAQEQGQGKVGVAGSKQQQQRQGAHGHQRQHQPQPGAPTAPRLGQPGEGGQDGGYVVQQLCRCCST